MGMITIVFYDGRQAGAQQTVYTDGGCNNNGDDNAVASAGIWFGQDDPRNESLRLPEALEKPSNQLGEITGASRASVIADETEDLTMLSDSMTMINAITDHLQKNEDNGWIGVADRTAHKALVASLCERMGGKNIPTMG
ncbi:hypothetical protein BDZ89DRAFT_1049389 [Hymenopellis radicata]|nr:hypothetical protein BDZ89DRAFT_1049389 [Hymenopellis radicata]